MVDDMEQVVKSFFVSDDMFYPMLRRTLTAINEGKTYPSPYGELIWLQFALKLKHESNFTMQDLLRQVLDGLDFHQQ